MARIGDVLEAAPAVGDFLVLGERVGDQREGAQVGPEGLRQGLGSGLARLRVGVLQLVERRLESQFLAADVEPEAGQRLVEESVPCAATGDGLLVEELLDPVLELVGLVTAQIEDPRPVVREARIVAHRCLDPGVVDEIELEHEEKKMRARIGHLLLHVAVELGVFGVRRVACIDQSGIGHDPADQLLDRLVVADGGAEAVIARLRRGLAELALPAGLECGGTCRGLLDVARELGRRHAGIKVAQVPFGQPAQFAAGRLRSRATGGGRCEGTVMGGLGHAFSSFCAGTGRGLSFCSPGFLSPCLDGCAKMIHSARTRISELTAI